MSSRRFIGPVGTIARAVVGGALVALVIWGPEGWGGDGLSWRNAVLGYAVFPGVLLIVQWLRTFVTTEPLRATDHVGFWLNLAVVAALFSINAT